MAPNRAAFAVSLALVASCPTAQDWRLVDSVIPSHASAAFDSARGRVVVVGLAGETREWDGVRWLHRPVAALPGFVLHLAFDSVRRVTIAIVADLLLTGPVHTWEFDGDLWTERSTPVAPPQLPGIALAFDQARARAVWFGGGSSVPSNATWEWDGNVWQQRFPAISPPARVAAAMAYDAARNRTVLFGGVVPNGFFGIPLQDTWEWDGTNWQQRSTATVPSARSGHRLAFDAMRQVTVMIGGSQLSVADTWEYDGVDWIARSVPMPPPRTFAGLAYDSRRGTTVLLGGVFGATRPDVWEWDGVTWTPRLHITSPSYLVAAATAYSASRDRLVLFGGYGEAGSSSATWEWDGSTWSPRVLPTSPPGRYSHAMWADGTFVYAFGGTTTGSAFANDTWRFDGSTWTQMPSATLPPPRHSASVAYDPTTGGALLFGGTQPGATVTYHGDTWRWSPSGWTQVATPSAPSPRGLAAMAGDPLRQRVVLWGGIGGAFTDTWEWDGNSWLQRFPLHQPPSGVVRSMAFEPTLGLCVLVTTASNLDWSLQTWIWTGADWVRLLTPSRLQSDLGNTLTAAPGRVRMFDGERLFELSAQPSLAATYGASCASGLQLSIDAWPRIGTAEFGLTSNGHAANAPVFFVIAAALASAPVGGCTLLVQPGGPLVPLVADMFGSCTFAAPLPEAPVLIGLQLFTQAWSLCPTGLCATNGADVTIGR